MTSRHLVCAMTGALLLGLAGAASAASTVGATDSTFMKHAAADGMAEVQMGQLALDKSSSVSVKQLAQRIVDDHTQANDKLKTLAASKDVTLPGGPDASAMQEHRRLAAMSGSGFDEAWAKDMVKDHKKAVALFTTESSKATDTEVKSFATTTLPVLKTHLGMAQKLNATPNARDAAMDRTKAMDASHAPMNPPVATPPSTPTNPMPTAPSPATSSH